MTARSARQRHPRRRTYEVAVTEHGKGQPFAWYYVKAPSAGTAKTLLRQGYARDVPGNDYEFSVERVLGRGQDTEIWRRRR